MGFRLAHFSGDTDKQRKQHCVITTVTVWEDCVVGGTLDATPKFPNIPVSLQKVDNSGEKGVSWEIKIGLVTQLGFSGIPQDLCQIQFML